MDSTNLPKILFNDSPSEPLTQETERELVRRYQQHKDLEARRILIESNLRFVIKTAFGYKNKGMSVKDLVQEGNLGLIEALDRFDLTKNCRLITYASWWIRLRMQRAIEQKSHQINLPINKLEMYRKLKAFQQQFEIIHSRKPYIHEIAHELSISEMKTSELVNSELSFQTIHSRDEEHPGVETTLVDENQIDPRDRIWMKEAKEKLRTAFEILTPQERDVLKHRYNIYSGNRGKRMSLRKVGLALGLSAEGVRRIEEKAMDKLRRPAIKAKMETLFAC